MQEQTAHQESRYVNGKLRSLRKRLHLFRYFWSVRLPLRCLST